MENGVKIQIGDLKNMNETFMSENVKELLAPLIEQGFTFEYFYEKGGDSSCAYVCRFKKGADYFDWRETSGENDAHFMVYTDGEYRFPVLKTLYPKAFRAFAIKHLFKKASMIERREFLAQLLRKELQEKPDFFGIKTK